MKVFAAEWKKTTVTEIRASDLWTRDILEPGDETKKNKFNRLFSELREEATADLPEGTREARLSTLPLIDARYNEAHAILMALLDTWVRDKREELTKSGAYNATSGILFKDYGGGYDGPRAHEAYLIVLDEKILGYYHGAKDAYNTAVTAGGYSGGWIVSDWEIERKISGRHGQLLDQARAWMRPSLAEIAILRPMSDYENLVRTRAGKTIESATAWTALEAKFFQAALDVVNELGRRVYEGAPEDIMPAELKTAEQLIRLRGTRYEEGHLLPLLALPCSEVNEILDSLDALLPQILDGSETARVYNRTYALLHTYQQLRCAVIVSDPGRSDVKGRPTRYVKLTDSNMRGFQAVLDDYWKTALLWAQIEREAAQSGRSQEYQTAKAAAYAEIQETIVKIQDAPWKGPLGRDPSGKIVPYAGIGIGYELYGDWIRTMAYEAHKEIKDLFTGVEKAVAEPEVYIVTEGYVAALLKKYSGWWGDPEHGVAAQPGFIKYSVLDPAWDTFEATVQGKIGSPSLTGIEQFEKDVESEYVKTILAVRDTIAGLRLSKAEKFPTRIVEIEELVEALPHAAYTIRDASNLLAELRLLHSQVPWDSEMQTRYGAICQALVEFIEPRGGMVKVAYPTETNAYYVDEEDDFKTDTEYDKILAEWVGMDYETELTAWKNTVWAKLITLEKRTDVVEWQYPGEQEKIVRDATTTYLRWRGTLIDFAKKRLEALTTRLRTGTATIEDRALAESGRNLIHPFVHGQVEELRIALEQMLPGAVLPAALKPFARFEPLKSVSGFDVEEFSFKHLDKLIKNWAEPRIKDDIAVEPKINGYRLILQSKEGDCRIYMEGATKDYSKIYKHLAAEIKALPTVILDGELMEEVAGKAVDRAALGKYRRSAVDDTNAIVYVFDILYFEDEDLHNKPYSERREILDKFFAGRSFKHLRKLPSWKVTSIDDLITKAKKADAYPSSEGFMAKTADSKYLLGRRTGEWSKAKRTTDLQVMILKTTKTKADDYVYRCGVLVKDAKGIDPKEIERQGAKEYVVLGNTFRTSVIAKPGEHLEVSITELVEQEGPQGKKYNWMLPKVKDKTTRAVDTLPYAREVGQLLSASIDLPWKFLTDKLNEAMATVSVPRLRALKAELFGVLADFNYIRLVRYAWNVVELIRERLGQAVDPLITNRGVEKIYEIGTVPRTTDRMLDEARSDYKVLTEDIQASPQQKAKRGGALAQILQGYVKTATGSLLALVEELLKEVQGFISILAKSGTQSVLDIDRKLADIERRLDDLLREEPDTLSEDVASLQTELKTLVKAIGESRDLFTEPIDRIFSRMEEVELPLHTSEGIRDWLRITKTLVSVAIGRIPVMIEAEVNRLVKELETCVDEHGGRIAECTDIQEAWLEARDRLERAREDFPSARFLLETSIPLELTGYWDEMTDTQKSIFKEDFDGLRTVLQEAKKMIKGLRGALWAAAKSLKLDLGCGQNKAPGFIGIDIKPGLGVDKIWNLEKGLPYPDDTADEIRAYHILEHLSNPIRTMSEIWRALRDGGILRFEIPSTKGEGADADPTHLSRWNSLSFAFYTDDELRESHDIPCKFDIISIEEEEDPETGAVYVRGILRARKTGRYAPSESVAPHFFALRDVAGKDTHAIEQSQQSASQSIAAAEDAKEEKRYGVQQWTIKEHVEFVRNRLAHGGSYLHGVIKPHYSYGARRYLTSDEIEERGEHLCEWLQVTDFEPLALQILEAGGNEQQLRTEILRIGAEYVRGFDLRLEEKARGRAPENYTWPLAPMEYEAPPGASQEWFNIAKTKASLEQDPMMVEILEEFGPEGANVFNKAIDIVASGLAVVSGCSGYYGGLTPAGVPFFVTAAHCVREGRVLEAVLPNGENVKLVPGVVHGDTQILFAEKPQKAAAIIESNIPLQLGSEPSSYALALSTSFNEAEFLRAIGDRYEEYASIFDKTEDIYEELHRYRRGYSGGPLINSRGEVIGLSSGGYFVGGDRRNKFAAYSTLEDLKELYRLNGIPLPEYLGGASKEEKLDGLYLVRRHADLIASGEKKIIIKSRKLPIAGPKLYLITGDEVLGEIELEEPEQIDMKRFSELRIQSLIKESEREEWWKDITKFYSYKIKSFKPFEPPKKYERKQGVQTIQKAVVPLAAAAKLTEKGEQPGNERLDWMAAEPSKIPIKGTLWTHTRGIDPEHKALNYDEMMKLSTKDDVLNLHHDVRFLWQARYLEGFSIAPTTPVLVRRNGQPTYTQIANLYQVITHGIKDSADVVDTPGLEVACDGEWIPVQKIGRHKTVKTLVIGTRGGYIEVTPNHSLFRETSLFDNISVRADQLKLGERLQFASYPEFPTNIHLDPGLAWVLGYFVADGYAEVHPGGSGDFGIADKDRTRLEKAQEKLLLLGFETDIVKYNSAPNTWILKAKSPRVIAQWFRMLCYEKNLSSGYKAQKKVPDIILRADIPAKRAFFNGYVTGDGYIDEWNAVTVASATALDMAGILAIADAIGMERLRMHWCSNKKSQGSYNARWGHSTATSIQNEIVRIEERKKTRWVYDLQTKNNRFMAGVGTIIAHNTIFLGNQEDKDKLLKYDGGKLGASIKQKQPPIWGDPKELNNRLFPPGEVGNVSGKETWGAMFLIDRVSLLPSRMRSKPKGKRYFEFALAFEKHKELNGLWGITEEAGAEYELPFMMFKLKETIPFWLRGKKKHEKEIEEMSAWQKPTQEAIDEFVKK